MDTVQKSRKVGLLNVFRNISFRKKKSSQELKDLIKDNKVLVLSKTYCPYCKRAKEHLNSFNLTGIKILELDTISNGDSLQKAAQKETGQRTVPNIWIGEKHIGGCDDLLSISAHELKQKLTEAGALV
uniref:Glutaredoxin domain-containing protein n=1 Tax=Aplanochytrium stocchinoi TaxID=215587 RepID=A0A7S3V2F6_9STRA|mmetsp:Transcript_15878/g.19690  ORF Transcript_15878/g.19690 Transcript_15878/m.19690 type:complete len:128 (+) Transcript_15878:367-750(+)